MKFRKKSMIISAWQLTEAKLKEMQEFVLEDGIFPQKDYAIISTLEGDMRAEINDWIITGINGEKYPCKPDIFEKTYEPMKENEVGE